MSTNPNFLADMKGQLPWPLQLQNPPNPTLKIEDATPNKVGDLGTIQLAAPSANVRERPEVKVTNGSGAPAPGIAVTFTASSIGSVVANSVVRTSPAGIADAGAWTLVDVGGHRLEAIAAGAAGAVIFHATCLSPAAAKPTGSGAPPVLPGIRIQLAVAKCDLNVGDTWPLDANLVDRNGSPVLAGIITWTSSDTTKATVGVAGGKEFVQAVKPGGVTLTATAGRLTQTMSVQIT